ncbi:MAG: DUF6111 family protein [Rhodospirillaceae bacterium]|nr:DUF6111 family protein [Rhodospirillaceae bacterium]MCY4238485.1 DUF6111 family protein [Rhodospirillaceae bacterium]MCY4309729.1 DUF6111 family protein [Rhodospirillaceae bacterium]
MVRTIIQQLAIFLIPLILYIIYFYVERRRAKKRGLIGPRWEDSPWFWITLSGLVLTVMAFVLFAVLKDTNPLAPVIPPTGPQT